MAKLTPSASSHPYGKMSTAAEVGAAIRTKRRSIGMLQAELASLAGVGTRFLSEVENGKPSAEIGKVLQVLKRLGLELSIHPRGGERGAG